MPSHAKSSTHKPKLIKELTAPTQRTETENSWLIKTETLVENNYDISAKNPNNQNEIVHLPPNEIIANIKKNDKVISQLMAEVESIINKQL